MTIYTDDAPETETIYNVSNFNNTMEFDGEGMLIAIIYTGLDYTHEAFLTDPSCPALNKDTIDTFIASTCANSLATNAKKRSAYSRQRLHQRENPVCIRLCKQRHRRYA